MSTVVARNKEAELDEGHIFHGLHKSIPWPEDGITAYRSHPGAQWTFTTIADVLACKREKMENNLRHKREYDTVKRVPLYVWVFFCPGINFFIFRGWWLYLKGLNYCDGKYLERDTELVKSIMKMFPLVEGNLFGHGDIEKWKQEFVKKYPAKNKWGGKPQGKSPVWAEFKNGRFIRLIERAEWPRKGTL
jgi:hypothetical protein